LNNFEKLIDFVRKYGAQLTSLNLKLFDIKDKEFDELVVIPPIFIVYPSLL